MVGYRRLPTSDPEEQRLRDAFHNAPGKEERIAADAALCKYIWDRAEAQVAVDRAKHPKAKRNQAPPSTGPSGGRILP